MNLRQPFYRSLVIPVLCALGFAGILLLMPLPKLGRASQAFGDLVHAPLFALLAAFILFLVRKRSEKNFAIVAIIVWLSLVAVGIVSELVQSHFGRSGSLHDMTSDILGATAGVVWAMFWYRRSSFYRRAAVTAILILILASYVYPIVVLYDVYLAYHDFPVLSSLERSTETMRWSSTNAGLSRSRKYATDGQWSLKIKLKVAQYSGATFVSTNRNWTDYEQLVFDMIWVDQMTEPDARLTVIIKIQDIPHNGDHDDRFHQLVDLVPGQQTEVRIHLDDALHAPRDRLMDMSRVNFVQIFTDRPQRRMTLHVDNMRLE